MKKLMLLVLVLGLVGSAWAANTLLPTGTADRVIDPTSDLVPGVQPSVMVPQNPPRTDALTWTTKTPAPLTRYWGAVGARQDTVYLAGGRMGTAASTRTMLAYIPATNAWINSGQPQTPPLPAPRRAGATGFNDSLLFYVCGRDSASATQSTTYQFNMRTKAWSTRAACPAAAWATAGAVAGNYFFRFGSEGALATLYRFDINANTWTIPTPPSSPPGRGWHTAASAGGLFYIMGGSPGLADCWAYDPTANTWTQRASMPGTRVYPSAIGVGDSVIVLCGGDLTGAEAADALVYVYHIAANTWTTETSMPTARGWQMMARTATKIYAIQGSNCTTPTYLNVNEEGSFSAALANDVGCNAIRAPGSMVNPGATITPIARVRNYGTANQTGVPTTCWIDSSGTRVYTGTATVDVLAGDTILANFTPTWTAGPTSGLTYNVTAFTALSTDGDRTNDTTRANSMTFTIVTSLVAPRGTAPTLDGNIQTAEWADANRYDLSDVLGNGGGNPGGSPPGTVYMYFKHDSANLYVGVDNNFASLADYDQLGLYFDDNNNDAWEADSSEGNFWWAYVAAGNRTIFRGIRPGPLYNALVEPIPGMTWAVAVQGSRHHYEGNVQIGVKPPGANYFLNASIPDTVGFYMYSQFNGAVQRGWWPTAMPNGSWNVPAAYGDLILLPATGVESPEPVKAPARTALYAVTPNPVKGMGIVRFALPAKSEFSLKLYDVQGRLVRTLAAGTREAGVHNVGLNGEGLAKGVYFYRLQAGAFSATRSLVVVR